MNRLRPPLALLTGLGLFALALAACQSEEAVISGRPVVGDIPWPATEEARYRLLDRDDELGSGVLTITTDGAKTTFRQEFDSESEEFHDETTAVADSTTLTPLSVERVIDGPDGERRWQVRYEGGTAIVEQRSEDDEREDRLSAPANSHDSGTDLFLWRTIDFAEGYETTYVDILTATLATPQVISQKLEVKRKETLEVPAGTFEAWRLEISSDDGDQTAWYADTEGRPLVRYDNGSLVFELLSLE